MNKMFSNTLAYIESMRLYGAGIAVLAAACGISLVYPAGGNIGGKITVLLVVFAGWGLNQIINDYFGQNADKINAPKRAIVSERINPKTALKISLFLGAVMIAISYIFSRAGAAVFAACLGLNLIYEKAKKIPLGGNFLFAIMLILPLYYSLFSLSNKSAIAILSDKKIMTLAGLIASINFIFALLTDFKDVRGDRITGTKSLPVLAGEKNAANLSLFLIFLPYLMFYVCITENILIWTGKIPLACLLISFAFLVWAVRQIISGACAGQEYLFLAKNISAVILFEGAIIFCL